MASIFKTTGRVKEIQPAGQYGQTVLIDIGLGEDKENIVMFEAYVKDGKSFFPSNVCVEDDIEFAFKPRTITGVSKTTGKPYAIMKISISRVQVIESAASRKAASKKQNITDEFACEAEDLPF
jgi:hypothetical protein